MDARKYAWKILHAEIRRRINPDEGLPLDPQLMNIASLWESAIEDGVSPLDVVAQLAGFGATFAQMTQNDPLTVAKRIEEKVLAEPDDKDEDDGDN